MTCVLRASIDGRVPQILLWNSIKETSPLSAAVSAVKTTGTRFLELYSIGRVHTSD